MLRIAHFCAQKHEVEPPIIETKKPERQAVIPAQRPGQQSLF